MAVPRFGEIAEGCQVGKFVKRSYGQTDGMKSTQIVTERDM